MEYSRLGRSDLQVSRICLGTMTFGEQNSEAEGHAQLDRALEAGVNFIDTAEMYPVPPRAETYGQTERIVGSWLARSGKREQLVIASKVCGPARDWLQWVREGKSRLDRSNIEAALDASLRRLGTDYLDLYQLHWPDRNTNYFGKLGYRHKADEYSVPLEETLGCLADLVRDGKIRHVGLSNETPWGVMSCVKLADGAGLPRAASIQNPYNLLNRTFEIGLAEIAHREDLGLLAYSPLGFGMLSGKYLDGARPEGARLTLFPHYARYSSEQALRATAAYADLAREHGLSLAQMALAWVNSRPFLTANIIGATSLEQLEENLSSIDVDLPEDLVEAIEAVHTRIPNPSP